MEVTNGPNDVIISHKDEHFAVKDDAVLDFLVRALDVKKH